MLQDLQALGSNTTLHRKVEKSLKKSHFGFNRGFHLHISQKNLGVDPTTVMLTASLRSDHDVVFMYVCTYELSLIYIHTHHT